MTRTEMIQTISEIESTDPQISKILKYLVHRIKRTYKPSPVLAPITNKLIKELESTGNLNYPGGTRQVILGHGRKVSSTLRNLNLDELNTRTRSSPLHGTGWSFVLSRGADVRAPVGFYLSSINGVDIEDKQYITVATIIARILLRLSPDLRSYVVNSFKRQPRNSPIGDLLIVSQELSKEASRTDRIIQKFSDYNTDPLCVVRDAITYNQVLGLFRNRATRSLSLDKTTLLIANSAALFYVVNGRIPSIEQMLRRSIAVCPPITALRLANADIDEKRATGKIRRDSEGWGITFSRCPSGGVRVFDGFVHKGISKEMRARTASLISYFDVLIASLNILTDTQFDEFMANHIDDIYDMFGYKA